MEVRGELPTFSWCCWKFDKLRLEKGSIWNSPLQRRVGRNAAGAFSPRPGRQAACRDQVIGVHRELSVQNVDGRAAGNHRLAACALQSEELTRDRQPEKLINVLRAVDVHDAAPQFFALIFADHVAAECSKLHCDLIFGHRIARIAFRNIDAR